MQGFPGSTGLPPPAVSYLLADRVVFPPEIATAPAPAGTATATAATAMAAARSEHLLYMPYSFFGLGYSRTMPPPASPPPPPSGTVPSHDGGGGGEEEEEEDDDDDEADGAAVDASAAAAAARGGGGGGEVSWVAAEDEFEAELHELKLHGLLQQLDLLLQPPPATPTPTPPTPKTTPEPAGAATTPPPASGEEAPAAAAATAAGRRLVEKRFGLRWVGTAGGGGGPPASEPATQPSANGGAGTARRQLQQRQEGQEGQRQGRLQLCANIRSEKVDPAVWEIWMNILRRGAAAADGASAAGVGIPGSVTLLLDGRQPVWLPAAQLLVPGGATAS